MKKIIRIIFLTAFMLILLIMLLSCMGISTSENVFFSMDSIAQVKVVAKDKNTRDKINEKIQEISESVENQISKTIESSDIYKLNGEDEGADISSDTIDLLRTAKYIKNITDGAFEPALGEIINLWGINENNGELPQKVDFYSALEKNKNYDIIPYDSLSRVMQEATDGKEMIVAESGEKLLFDLGAMGKGYALDKVSGYLKKERPIGVLLSYGSSILAFGKTQKDELWTIGIKNPLDTEKICGFIGATNKVISVSGGYERYIEIDGITYCHIIDPFTGYPVDNDLLCVVVVIDSREENSGATSDALSTALYVMGKQGALDFYAKGLIDFEMILFVKADTEKGYDIISTNLIFSEIE